MSLGLPTNPRYARLPERGRGCQYPYKRHLPRGGQIPHHGAMTAWTDDQLDRIGRTAEIEIAPRRPDGSLLRSRPIWVVRVDDDLYVRSYRGPDGAWYRTARTTGGAQLSAGRLDVDVRLAPATDIGRDQVDDAYRSKYGRSAHVDTMVADGPAGTTLRVLPR